MGNTFSDVRTSINDQSAREIMSENNTVDDENYRNLSVERKLSEDDEDYFFEARQDIIERPTTSKIELAKFKEELAEKREERKKILAKFTGDVTRLKDELNKEKARSKVICEENVALRLLLENNNVQVPEEINRSETKINDLIEIIDSVEEMSISLQSLKEQNKKLRVDLSESNLSLQAANSEMANLHCQNIEAMKQIESLKEVVAASKTMIKIREEQLEKVSGQLKQKVDEIQKTLADREARMLSTDLRDEYEKQLQNIRDLRVLYEERARLAEVTRRNLVRELEEQKTLSAEEVRKCKELTEKVVGLEGTISDMNETIENKNEQISVSKAETKGLQAEMSAINKLFTQMLLGYKSGHNLDKLVRRLEEHHGLLTHMVTMEDTIDGSALPKLLLDIVNQVEDIQSEKDKDSEDETSSTSDNDEDNSTLKSPEEIVGNLPKVWRVLLELLSQQSGKTIPNDLASSSCYKSVDTPSGPRMVPSVSQTYIRLKDLIVEKMSLVKDMNKMKKLNSHLETRLSDQERRLCLVTSELTKTWHVVGRLRRHHHQLHTHEKILRYELQQKRKLLNEIKEEFEYCKEKWDKAREKNAASEKELKRLRSEYSSRRQKILSFHSIASPESGFSDEKQSEDDSSEWIDENECINDTPKSCKKKLDIHDSSTDNNLIAEGEDPISDMHDIADLPLDLDDHQEKHSHHLENNKNVIQSEAETRSENSSAENTDSFDKLQVFSSDEIIGGSSEKLTRSLSAPDTTASTSCSTIHSQDSIVLNPKVILENVKRKQDSLAKRSLNLENTENLCKDLANKRNEAVDEKSLEVENAVSDTRLGENSSVEQDQNSNTQLSESHEPSIVNIEEPNSTDIDGTSNAKETSDTSLNRLIDPKEILANVKKQQERLDKRDSRLESMESCCNQLVSKTKAALEAGNSLCKSSNDLQDRVNALPGHSSHTPTSTSELNVSTPVIDSGDNVAQTIRENNNDIDTLKITHETTTNKQQPVECFEVDGIAYEFKSKGQQELIRDKSPTSSTSLNYDVANTQNDIGHSTNEDEKLESSKVPDETNDDVKDNLNTDKLDSTCKDNIDESSVATVLETPNSSSSDCIVNSNNNEQNTDSPNMQTPAEHEARFAARDVRLKRLEEQTKSLVDKVNGTNSKSVKLTYKLEELHNIYGSETREESNSEDED